MGSFAFVQFLAFACSFMPAESAREGLREARKRPALEAVRFEGVGAKARLSAVLSRIESGNLSRMVGSRRWNELVREYRPYVEAAASHEAFGRRLNELFAATGQSHLRYFTEDEWDYWLLSTSLGGGAAGREVDHVGIYPRSADGRWFVGGILDGSPADGSELLVGDELVAVDGEPFGPIKSFRGKSGVPVRIEARRGGGDRVVVELVPVRESLSQAVRRAMRASIRGENYDGHQFLYAHVWMLLGAGSLFADLAERSPDVDGVILDFRDGVGGTTGSALWYLLGRGPAPRGAKVGPPMTKPVVILTGEGTRSAKEIVVDAARRMGRALLVGEATAGAVTAVDTARSGPVGADAYLLLPGERLKLEGRPTQPDFLMSRVIPYSGGRDPQLEMAREVLAAWLTLSDAPDEAARAPVLPLNAAGTGSD